MTASNRVEHIHLTKQTLIEHQGKSLTFPALSLLAGTPWTIEVRIDPQLSEMELISITDQAGSTSLRLLVRQAGSKESERDWDDHRQNYLAWADTTGVTLVLEVEVAFARIKPWRIGEVEIFRLGFPIPLIDSTKPIRVGLQWNGVRLVLAINGVVVDEDWPTGRIAIQPDRIRFGETANLEELKIWTELREEGFRTIDQPTIPGNAIQYWSPPGHNQWFGDVMLFSEADTFHLYYLLDRRHGESKSGAGGHQIAHLSTTDLQSWQTHPLSIPITHPWETCGTGSLVKYEGRYFFYYGIHTDRIVEREFVATASEAGAATPTGFLAQPYPPNLLPMGTTVAISDDGIRFEKLDILVNDAQNPSVFQDAISGKYYLIAGYGAEGTYVSDDLESWTKLDVTLVPAGKGARYANSTECICHLEWNGWHYLIGGRSGWWRSTELLGPYQDCSDQGGPTWDVYDGLWVPMMASLPSGRVMLIGWLQDVDWAGNLVIRELHQKTDGNLTLTWPEEVLPPTGPSLQIPWSKTGQRGIDIEGNLATVLGSESDPRHATLTQLPEEYLLEVWIEGNADCGICLLGSADYRDGCELRISPKLQRVQWNRAIAGCPAPRVPTIEEILAEPGERFPIHEHPSQNIPFKGGDFAVSKVEGLDTPFLVRILVTWDQKSRSHIVDASIAGKRTLITRRRGYTGRDCFLFSTGETRFTVRTLSPVSRSRKE